MTDNLSVSPSGSDEPIGLNEIFFLLLGKWKSIAVLTSFAAIFSVFYSLSLPNLYQSSATLKPASTSGISSMTSQYAGLASLAGITMPTDPQMDNATLALEVIVSKDFFEILYKKENFLINIMALEGYDKNTSLVTIDSDIYDKENKTWTREPSPAGNIKPSLQEAHEVFLEDNLSFGTDIKTGVVSIIITHMSPNLAHSMTLEIVKELNAYMKDSQTDRALKSKIFLEGQLAKTDVREMQKVISSLLQKEMQTLLLSSITDDFVFEYLDKPRVAERKSAPGRAMMCIFGTIIGGLISIILVLIAHTLKVFLKREA